MEHDYELDVTEQREPTPEEWEAFVARGEVPWDDTIEQHYETKAPCPEHPPAEDAS